MMAIYGPLALILTVAFYIMLAHIIMSWLISFQVLNLHQQLVCRRSGTWPEPACWSLIYRPIRRILPPMSARIDLAPLIALIGVIMRSAISS